jgi:cephalosporin-C deacetylase-like acetyl esterase
MTIVCRLSLCVLFIVAWCTAAAAQPLGEPDRGAPGDEMVQAYLARETAKLSAKFSEDVKSLEAWQTKRPQYVEEYYYMLGLSPRPEKSPLNATITGTYKGDGFEVDMIHYQSKPRLYVTGNLYRPAETKAGEKLPAVLYVCGHSGRGRNGNKVAFQSHGIWLARHGYVCLMVDTLQLGEIAAFHHGTYNLNRWWWHSRGYTPAGVEAWNGVRGIDYLLSRDDVDPERLAVTGISGGGASTLWIAAADERVKVAVPVSGMADLESYVPNRVINGHCDCMFLYNTFQWPWTRIAGLIAPRPLQFVNSDDDSIFPMDANERISNRLERLYSLYGESDRFDTIVSVGGHAYRQDLREGIFGFLNAQLKGDARPVADTEIDVVSEGRDAGVYPIPIEKLRVFPTDADIPADELNTKIDEHFVPLATAPAPGADFAAWKDSLQKELRRVSFAHFPDNIAAARRLDDVKPGTSGLESETGIWFHVHTGGPGNPNPTSVLLVVLNEDEAGKSPDWLNDVEASGMNIALCEPRGIGETRWTRKNGPNYVERSHALLGRTVDAGRVWDVIAAAKYLAGPHSPLSPRGRGAGGEGAEAEKKLKIHVAGKGPAGLIAAYAAALDDSISGVTIVKPLATHMDNTAPQFLNVLRVCDVPDSLGLIAPRPLTLVGADAADFKRTTAAYTAAEAGNHLTIKP